MFYNQCLLFQFSSHNFWTIVSSSLRVCVTGRRFHNLVGTKVTPPAQVYFAWLPEQLCPLRLRGSLSQTCEPRPRCCAQLVSPWRWWSWWPKRWWWWQLKRWWWWLERWLWWLCPLIKIFMKYEWGGWEWCSKDSNLFHPDGRMWLPQFRSTFLFWTTIISYLATFRNANPKIA